MPFDSTAPGSPTPEAGGANAMPALSLPRGGGAIRGIGEKFAANPVTGTASLSVPVFVSPCAFAPALAIVYDSGAGNGPFGLGWSATLPAIARKTDRGLPQYRDADDSDVFLLSDAEDLVPVLVPDGADWKPEPVPEVAAGGRAWTIRRYRPRIEAGHARIERWTDAATGIAFWKTVSADNVTSLYGTSAAGRVADPDDPARVFRWLLQQRHDGKGNAIVVDWKAEDGAGIAPALHESGRRVGAQRYLKAIRYGNATPFFADADPLVAPAGDWHFQLVLDYGEHDADAPSVDDAGTWLARGDPFSSYRAGFEIRSHRLCRRALMFHAFAELGPAPCLVRATEFAYVEGDAPTFLASVRQVAYRHDPPGSRALPPVSFDYSAARVDETVRTADADTLENLPAGVDGAGSQWLDLDGEGLPGVLVTQAGAWFYKRNLGALPVDDAGTLRAALAPLEQVATRPTLADATFEDLAGDGPRYLVRRDGPTPGFHRRGDEFADADDWQPFTAFPNLPDIDWSDPNLRRIDLDGDGLADVLVSGHEAFTWYQALATDGFAPARRVPRALDEDAGPALVFADGTQSIFVADMSGDGLADLVRIRNAEVCYWPNLGYGRFGAKVTMGSAPAFDTPERFDPRRIRLVDIDGSGTTDIVYLASDAVVLHFNRSGNAWGTPHALAQGPAPDRLASVATLDLLGNGTACLAWSSPLPGDAGCALRYVDLMGGTKPHLLIGVRNHLGAETTIAYAPSTRFYLEDRRAGRPWVTRLPFPVHVVERVQVDDRVGKTRTTTRYAYHHGYFDSAEREFRGFGLVEQWDSDAITALGPDAALELDAVPRQPPMLTRTWFHTGAWLPGARISLHRRDEYWREPGLADDEVDAMRLPDTVLPPALTLADGSPLARALTPDEQREACRALKGSMLRRETFAQDGTALAPLPFDVAEHSFTLQWLQPRGDGRHAVFATTARESLAFRYERSLVDVAGTPLADPRVVHTAVLAVDAFGNPLRSVSLAYGRRHDADAQLTPEDAARQQRTLATLTETRYTTALATPAAWRAPVPCETLRHELHGLAPQPRPARITRLPGFDALAALVDVACDGQHELAPEDVDASGAIGAGPFRRLVAQTRTLFRDDGLAGALPLGTLDTLALPFESYALACTPGQLAALAPRMAAAGASALLVAGGHRDLDGDGRLWSPSGQAFFSPDPDQPDAAFARAHRFLPQGGRDPFGNTWTQAWDAHDLFVARTVDAAGNAASADHDYRVLQPWQLTDANGNRAQAAFDVAGLPVANAAMGKAIEPDGHPKGDALDGVAPDLAPALLEAFRADPVGQAAALLGAASTRIVVDRDRFDADGSPAWMATLARETHASELAAGERSRIRIAIAYSDGFGRVIQTKTLAAPGPLDPSDAASPVATPRWVGSGWTVFDGKGRPVRRFEPFFSATPAFEFALQAGVAATLFHDPAGRAFATLHPDRSYEKVVRSPWREESWDVNDTVLLDARTDPDLAAQVAQLAPALVAPSWHALRADPANAAAAAQRWPDATLRAAEADAAAACALHAATPAVAHLDALGRVFLAVEHNRAADDPGPPVDTLHRTLRVLDIDGRPRAVVDALGRTVVAVERDLAGRVLRQASMDAGARWALADTAGQPLRAWDDRGHALRHERDALRRPTDMFVTGADATQPAREVLVSRTVYGEGAADDVALNLRTRVLRRHDAAGIATSSAYDFKGRLLGGTRQLVRLASAADCAAVVDWSAPPALDPALVFTTATRYDALDRAIELTAPDGSVTRPQVDEAGLLARVEVALRGASAATVFVDAVTHDARARRLRVDLGNGATTRCEHEPETGRLARQTTTRAPVADVIASQVFAGAGTLQDLRFTSDAMGNLVRIEDAALRTTFHANQQVDAVGRYGYDALYRLCTASGREHAGQSVLQSASAGGNWRDLPFAGNAAPSSDLQALRNWTQSYAYDLAGNLTRMRHQAAGGGWTRDYVYAEPSTIEPALAGNRLTRTQLGATAEPYAHDAHGNITRMPHLPLMQWDWRDQLQATATQVVDPQGGASGPETTWLVVDDAGRRLRKITTRQNGTRKCERIYIDGYELWREYDGTGANLALERTTLHVMDGASRVALVDTLAVADGAPVAAPRPEPRWQVGNHQQSATLELDADAALVSYEEYQPFGATCFQAGTETSRKRYRHLGSERDEESGLAAHGVRAYAPWLGRWTSCDPQGIADGLGLYTYARDNPLTRSDRNGMQSRPDEPTPNANPPPQLPPPRSVEDVQAELAPKNHWHGELRDDLPHDLREPGGATLEELQAFWARQGISLFPEFKFSTGPAAAPPPWFIGDVTKTSPAPGLDPAAAASLTPPATLAPWSQPLPAQPGPFAPAAPWTPQRLYPDVYVDSELTRRKAEAAAAVPPLSADTAGGTLPKAALTANIPPPYAGPDKPRTVADMLGPLLTALAPTALVAGLVGYAANSVSHSADGDSFSQTTVGIGLGLIFGGVSQAMSKDNPGAAVTGSWSPKGAPSIGPVTRQDQPPAILPPQPPVSLGFSWPLNSGLLPWVLDTKKR